MATGRTYVKRNRYVGKLPGPIDLAQSLSNENYFYPTGPGTHVTYEEIYENSLKNLVTNVEKLKNDGTRHGEHLASTDQSIATLYRKFEELAPLVGYLADLKRITDLDIVNENDAGLWETWKYKVP